MLQKRKLEVNVSFFTSCAPLVFWALASEGLFNLLAGSTPVPATQLERL